MGTKFNNTVGPNEILTSRFEVPKDLHWVPNGTFIGEIYDVRQDKYYSARADRKYISPEKNPHLDRGHFQGYRFAALNYCPEGGMILDPTAGSGTAIVEANNMGRKGIGIELEWPDYGQRNIDFIGSGLHGEIFPGNAKDIKEILPVKDYFDLVVNGTPYPTIGKDGGISQDAPMLSKDMETKNYTADGSFGLMGYPNGNYESFIRKMYKDIYPMIKRDGFLCLIIKDPIRNGKPFYLQKMLIDWIKEDTGMKDHSWFVHAHIPRTFSMNVMAKKANFQIPLYQIGVVLQK